MFLTNQAAGFQKHSKLSHNQDGTRNEASRNKNTGRHVKLHVNKAQSFDYGGCRQVPKNTQREEKTHHEYLPKSAPGSPTAGRKAPLTSKHLNAVISPKTALRNSQTLLKKMGSTEKLKDTATYTKDNTSHTYLNQIAARSFCNLTVNETRDKNLLYVEDFRFQKSSSLPELSCSFGASPAKIKWQTVAPTSTDDLPNIEEKEFAIFSTTDTDENNRDTSSSYNEPLDSGPISVDCSQRTAEEYDFEDRLIPLHASALFSVNRNSYNKGANKRREMMLEKRMLEDILPEKNQCFAYGEGLNNASKYQTSSFYVEFSKLTSSVDIEVKVTGPRILPPKMTVKQIKKGKYEIEYTPNAVGNHEISVKCQGEHINKSPFTFSVTEQESTVWVLA